jgi:N-acyl-L-homoserine lactone synthetase
VSAIDVRLASSPAEREAAFSLRYEVYVEELQWFGDVADHDARRLEDPVDSRSELLLATAGDEVLGTMRLTFGADGPFPEYFVERYGLDPFTRVIPSGKLAVGTRFMVRREERGRLASVLLLQGAATRGLERDVELAFCVCKPHLLGLWLRLGFRTYRRMYNDETEGLMVPLVLVMRDRAHLERVGSPLLASGFDALEPTEATAAVLALLPERPPVRSIDLHGDYDWSRELEGGEDERRHALRLFDGLTEEELAAAIAHSHIIDAEPGQLLIRRGEPTRTMYLVLGGSVEIRDGDRLVRTLGPGASVGEIAFLLRRTRTLDVVIGADGAKLLSLHEPALRELLESRSHAAGVVLLNLAKSLAGQLAAVGDNPG